jgi:meiosis-specific transcription factor NDT80
MSFPAPSFHPSRNQAESPPFEPQEQFVDLKQDDGSAVLASIHCKIEKGFFISQDSCWTCYRRNYFSVQCSYSLFPLASGRNIYLERSSKSTKYEQVQAMAICLSAVVDGTAGKTVELVQHTPKRDRGPQSAVQKTKIMPMMDTRPPHASQDMSSYAIPHYSMTSHHPSASQPIFPLQQASDPTTGNGEDHSGSAAFGNNTQPNACVHTFERIQFKSATANNGKRRAQQQYYHLIVELWADVRTTLTAKPDWVKVAQRLSSQVVVRGRSPSHYSNEGPNSVSRGGTSGGLGGSSTSTPHPWSPASLTPAPSSSYHPLPRYTGGSTGGYTYNLSAHSHHSNHDDQTSTGSSLLPLSDSSHMDALRNIASTGPTGSYSYLPANLYDGGHTSPSFKAMVKSESRLPDHHTGVSSGFSTSGSNCRYVTLEGSKDIYNFANAPIAHEPGY